MNFIRILISQVTCILVLNDEILASGYEDKIIRLFNITTGQVINELNGHNNSLTSLVLLDKNIINKKI
jgi:WD40 repeat protein